MRHVKTLLPVALFILLPACVSESQISWKPLVDTANDPRVGSLNVDYAECQRLAVHTPAGIGGLNQNTPEEDEKFKQTYIDCMQQRGHPIITANTAQVPTPAVYAPPGMKGYGGR